MEHPRHNAPALALEGFRPGPLLRQERRELVVGEREQAALVILGRSRLQSDRPLGEGRYHLL